MRALLQPVEGTGAAQQSGGFLLEARMDQAQQMHLHRERTAARRQQLEPGLVVELHALQPRIGMPERMARMPDHAAGRNAPSAGPADATSHETVTEAGAGRAGETR